jgi:hypothetical protein
VIILVVGISIVLLSEHSLLPVLLSYNLALCLHRLNVFMDFLCFSQQTEILPLTSLMDWGFRESRGRAQERNITLYRKEHRDMAINISDMR